MAKLKRKQYRTYFRTGKSGDWQLLGKGIDSLEVSMNGTFDTTTDVTGETSTSDDGYTPELGLDTYYADPTDKHYDFLVDLAMNRKSGDDAIGQILEVIIEDDEATDHKAWQEDVKVEINSYGGDTSGFQIPFTLHFDGNREEGTVKYTEKKPAFTPADGTL